MHVLNSLMNSTACVQARFRKTKNARVLTKELCQCVAVLQNEDILKDQGLLAM